MSRYLIGLDLGTTNSALAYVDTREKVTGAAPRLHTFKVPQVVAAGQVGEADLLPSFLYLPGPHDLPPGSVKLPWNADASEVVGQFARSHGAKVPGRQVASAKSWLCHPGVDRTSPLLPWTAPPEVTRLSPLEVSTRYLRHFVDAWNNVKGKHDSDKLEEQNVVITVPASFDDVARNLTAEAAKQAGLKHVTLVEEPQAAFYAWLGTHDPREATQLKPGMRCLVVDVGGGTSDFSLIRVAEGEGDITFLRDAIGQHLLLGGDNMDLALAKAVEAKLPAGKLEAAQFGGLIQACRAAKEALLVAKPPESFPVTVVGKGRSVVGGTVSMPLTAHDVRQSLFEGFFPAVPFEAMPTRTAKTGLQEMGLPYVTEAAVTKHLAAFLKEHLPTGETLDAILFNGGVFQPPVLRERLVDVLRPWFGGESWKPLVLTSPSLDLAVAWGAAYYAWLKQSGGRKIGGGIPRSYYIGVQGAGASGQGQDKAVTVLCVVPRRLEEGQEITLKEPVLELAIGQPVLFPLFTSTVRGEDAAGAVLTLSPQQLLRLPPLHTVLRGGKRAGTKQVQVTLAAKCTEIGTLELSCVSPEGNRWRLEFNVRDVLDDDADTKPANVVDVWPEEKVQAAAILITSTFAGSDSPQELPRKLDAALEASRADWPTGLCRRLWDPLNEGAEGRSRGPQYLSRWYNLTGFCLRPGFGDTLDKYRVEALWKIITSAASNATGKPALPEGGADFWIMIRRVAGGLNAALQQSLMARMRPTLLPGKGKPPPKPSANELAEMWRAAASLERIDTRTRELLGSTLLESLLRTPVPPYLFWSLTRLGARVQLYGPLNTLVHVRTVEAWLERLLAYSPSGDSDRLGWAFCMAQLARKSGVRAVDVDDSLRMRVLDVLNAMTVPAAWKTMLTDVTHDSGEEQSRLFGESLPIGLRLSVT
ncbi:Hsp70 family protein [soil metagenome]